MLSKEEILGRLRTLREARSLLQEHVARSLGIDRTTYVRKEKGHIPITTEEWLKLAQAMQADPAYFFGTPEAIEKDSKDAFDEDDLLRLYRSLNHEERLRFVCGIREAVRKMRQQTAQDAL
ncbi:MAG: helix-turn-helix transcriptional regulator [Deltaproteobacteria bacterium]|nr:helix-turn-helix transcriptional regulator [Deltaproteobacteria bacterium]